MKPPSGHVLRNWLPQIAAGRIKRQGSGWLTEYSTGTNHRINRTSIHQLEDAGLIAWGPVQAFWSTAYLTSKGEKWLEFRVEKRIVERGLNAALPAQGNHP